MKRTLPWWRSIMPRHRLIAPSGSAVAVGPRRNIASYWAAFSVLVAAMVLLVLPSLGFGPRWRGSPGQRRARRGATPLNVMSVHDPFLSSATLNWFIAVLIPL